MLSRYIDNFDYSSRFRILKGGKISLVVSALLASVTLSFASPVGEQIVSGNVQIDRTTSNVTNITQSTNKSIINWQSFNVAGNETVNFNMPSATSSSLNRVVGNNKSEIYGKINSNGQVFLVNQNGVYFSKEAQVNTAGFTASTRDISDENFLNGNYIFEGNSDASIINLGTITTDNAYTALLAKKVENEGVIKAHLGSVQLASGERFTLDINGNSLVKLTIDKGTLDGLVANKGAIIADGGEIYLTTSALDTVLNGLVNNTGIIQANSVEEKDGKIIFFAHGGTGEFGGSIEAVGGFVETSGKEFDNKADLTVKAKEWLIDPVNITIDSTLAGAISTALGSDGASVVISTAAVNTPDTSSGESGTEGDIFVNSAISWSTNGILTLRADNNIYINANITNNSTGTLRLRYGQGSETGITNGIASFYTIGNGASVSLTDGIHFITQLGNDTSYINYTVINDKTALQNINNNKSGNFAIGSNINASGGNWTPIGDSSAKFTGKFDGLGHTVSSYFVPAAVIDDLGNSDPDDDIVSGIHTTLSDIGLFGYTNGATIQNLGIEGASVSSSGQNIGALIGTAEMTTVNNITIDANSAVWGHRAQSFDEASQTATHFTARDVRAGGLIGLALGGSVSNITSAASVYGDSFDYSGELVADRVGGLIGETRYGTETTDKVTISNITIDGAAKVIGRDRVGGVIGYANTGTILDGAIVRSNIVGRSSVGGAVGYAQNGTIFKNIQVSSQDGPKLTVTAGDSAVTYKYVDGAFLITPHADNGTGYSDVGGIIGAMYGTATLSTSWSDTIVFGNGRNIGGAVGELRDTATIDQVISYGIVASDPSQLGYLQGSMGGLVGRAKGTDGSHHISITNSYTEANVFLTTVSGNTGGVQTGVGGLVGYVENAYTDYNYANGTVTPFTGGSYTNVGGLIGIVGANSSIVASYFNNGAYASTVVLADASRGKTTAEFETGSAFRGYDQNIWSIGRGVTIDGYEVNRAYLKNVTPEDKITTASTLFQSGWGTVINPYIITSATQLQNMNNANTLQSGYFYNLSSDVNLADVTWTPIGNNNNTDNHFMGTFDGLGHTVSNLSITATNNYNQIAYGLFGAINQATLKNLTLSNVNINSENDYVGALVGIGAGSTIDNVRSSGVVTSVNNNLGGLAGRTDNTTIVNSSSSVVVSGNIKIGGLVGIATDSTINNSFATGTVNATGPYVGGLVGSFWDGTLSNSYATGAVTGDSNVGGLIGDSGKDNEPTNTISNVYATGKVIGINSIGGLIGRDEGSTISNSHATGDVGSANTRGDYSGGLIGGFLHGSLSDSYATGNVYGLGYVGGLLGTTNGVNIARVYATGSVDATNTDAGGLIGMQYVDKAEIISDVYATGSVTSTSSKVGGLIGGILTDGVVENRSLSISNSYATGNVATISGENAGRFIDSSWDMTNSVAFNNTNGLTISNSFYSTNSTVTLPSGSSETTGFGVGKSATEFKKLSTFSGDGWTWNMTTDRTLNKNTILSPTLVANEAGVMHWVMPLYTTALNYTLATANTTYNGLDQALSSFWTNSIFGTLGSSLVAGTDYKFVYGSADTTSFKNAGTYNSISVQLLNSDYELDSAGTNTAGKLVIAKADATVTANSDLTKVYNGVAQIISGFTATGLVNGETISVLNNVSASGTGKNAGTYTVTASGEDENYNLTFVDGSLVIGKKVAIVTANSDTVTYNGQAQTISGFTATGLVNDETIEVLDGVSGTTATGTNAGTYNTALTGTDENYNLVFEDGSLVIGKKDATVTADDLTKIYGATDATLTYTTDGLVGSDTLIGSLTREVGENVGEYVISEDTTLANSNYTITFENGTYTITPKAITVTAQDKSKLSGEIDPALTFVASGLVGNDTLNGKLSRTTGESVGNYAISKGSLANSNYALNFVNGNFEIKQNATVNKVVETIVPTTPTPPPTVPTSTGRGKGKVTTTVTTTVPSGSIAVTAPQTTVTEIVKAISPELSGSTDNFTLVSQLDGQTEVTKVTMEELAQQAPNSEIRVALGGDSLAELVQGGVSLPAGLSQEYYVIKDEQ